MITTSLRRSLAGYCLLLLGLTFSGTAYAQSKPVADAEAYRDLLLELVELADAATAQMQLHGFRTSIATAATNIQMLDNEQLEFLTQFAPPPEILRGRLESNQHLLTISSGVGIGKGTSGSKQIEFPEPETTIAACENVSSSEGFESLVTFYTARELLVALTFPCLESVAGENDASACTAFKVVDAALEAANKGVQACLQEQRDAYLDTILDTEENIADHLESFVDATTSSRATQDSVDDVQTDITTGLSLLDTLQSDLDSDLLSLESDMDTVLSDLDALITDAVSLAATTSDIQFRVQENQVDIEDAQTRAADAEATAEEIRTDTQSIISAIETLQNDLDGYTSTLNSGLADTQKAALIAALADENTRIVRFLLPGSAGGELEQIRELVIQAITAFDNLGIDTTASNALLIQGDTAYNQGQYINAYNRFAQAYRTLTVRDDASKPGTKR